MPLLGKRSLNKFGERRSVINSFAAWLGSNPQERQCQGDLALDKEDTASNLKIYTSFSSSGLRGNESCALTLLA